MYIHLIFDVYKAFEQSRAYPASNYPQINKVDAPSSIFYTALYGVEEFSYKHFIAPPPSPPPLLLPFIWIVLYVGWL